MIAAILLTLITAFATLFVQVFCLSILQLGDWMNHPWLYLGIGGLGFFLWCFAAESP